jgi:hypothetical protein
VCEWAPALFCKDLVWVAAVVMRGQRGLVGIDIDVQAAVGVNRLSAIDVNRLVALARIEVFQPSSSRRCFVLRTFRRSWKRSFMCRINGDRLRSETTLAWGSTGAI